ncbi:hypothetical protein [Streptococcus pantholopis]|uniref:LXG domain-containing protein n=1 Tax=Streptococcus pantholopis TaxID=1811193 RepID=A0A172Q995_9STRE|nr:hypothetical protein [Streptococcus pantholopis]AND80011.1 hypothetical protein A0O21_08350 [Streptococcus pantholopis]
MAEGKFKIPLDSYYSVSGTIKGKVTELADSVESDFLNKVGNNIGDLDSRDAAIVEGFESYTSAQTELETLRTHETNLNNMSMEGGSNPLNGVVSTDTEYSSTFSGLADGTATSQVSSVAESLDIAIQSKKAELDFLREFEDMVNGVLDSDTAKRLIQLAKTNPTKALEKLLMNDKFLKTISQNGKIDSFFWKLMEHINDAEKLPQTLMNALADNSTFVKWASKLSVDKQDKVLNLMVKISDKGFDFLNKGGKVLEWAGKIAEARPVKILSKFANSGLGKVITSPWTLTAAKGVVSAAGAYMDAEDEAYHDLGKSVTGGVIDAVASVGPIDGALMGASVAGPLGGAVGFFAGVIIQGVQFLNPNLKSDIKSGAYQLIDQGRHAGQAATAKMKEVVSTAGQAISQGASNLTKNITNVGKSAQQLLGSAVPAVSWFG